MKQKVGPLGENPISSKTNIKREKTQITNINNETEETTTDLSTIKRIIKEYHEQLYDHKFNNLEEIGQFLKNHKLS